MQTQLLARLDGPLTGLAASDDGTALVAFADRAVVFRSAVGHHRLPGTPGVNLLFDADAGEAPSPGDPVEAPGDRVRCCVAAVGRTEYLVGLPGGTLHRYDTAARRADDLARFPAGIDKLICLRDRGQLVVGLRDGEVYTAPLPTAG